MSLALTACVLLLLAAGLAWPLGRSSLAVGMAGLAVGDPLGAYAERG